MLFVMFSSCIFFIIGCFICYRTSKNVFSSTFLSCCFLGLAFLGSLMFVYQTGHLLTPLNISVGVLAYGIGTLFSSGMVKFKPEIELNHYKSQTINLCVKSHTQYFLILLVLYVLSVALLIYFLLHIGSFLTSLDPAKARTESVQGNGFFYRSFLTYLPLTFICFWIYQKQKIGRIVRFVYLVVVISTVCALVLFSSRGAIVILLIPFLIVYGYLSKRRPKMLMLVAVALLVILFAVAFQYTYIEYKDFSFLEALRNMIIRITADQAIGVDHIIYRYVPVSGFQNGEVLKRDVESLLGTVRLIRRPDTSFQQEIFTITSGSSPVRANFTISTTSIGDLYADFGSIGVAIGMFFYGIFSQLIYMKTLRAPKIDLVIVGYSYLQYVILLSHIGGGFFGNFANQGLSLLLFLGAVVGLTVVTRVKRRKSPEFVICN